MTSLQEDVRQVMQTLFQRYPSLCGFSVREDLSFSNVSCHPELPGEDARELREEISAMLRLLVEESPEVAQMLPGRTFARIFH